MNNASFVIVGVLAVVGLIVVGVLAGQIGGDSLSSKTIRATTITLLVNQPVARGEAVTVQWDPSRATEGQLIELLWRDDDSDTLLVEATLAEGAVEVVIPCELESSEGSIVLRDATTKQVYAHRFVSLMPPGAICGVAAG